MSYEIVQTVEFEKEAKYLSKKHISFKNDLSILAESLADNPLQGTPLGNNCYKIRFAISSKGRGKSGGARIITFVVVHQQSVLLVGVYDKSEKAAMSNEEIAARLKSYIR